MDECPGVPMSSGMRPVADQDKARREHRALQERIRPKIESSERARRYAMEHMHEAVIG